MNWIYRNDTKRIILFRNLICKPDEVISSYTPIPLSTGLTCLQEGTSPDPVLLHDDVIVAGGADVTVPIKYPENSRNVALAIFCMTDNGGVECYFNSRSNNPVPVDARGFVHTLDWEMCSQLILHNPSDIEATISVTAVEVVN